MNVQISIIHYADEHELCYNDVLVTLVKSIRELTQYPYTLNIIDNQSHPKARQDLNKKLPDVDIISTTGKHHTYPAGCNKCIETMKGDYLVILHTDFLVTWNWLTALVQDLQDAEHQYGTPCAILPLLLPYPQTPDTPSEKELEKARDTGVMLDLTAPENVRAYMDKHGIPWKSWNNIPLAISHPGLVTDNGSSLGVYIASKRFYDVVGPYDESLGRFNDKDYGIRALMTECHDLISNRVYLHHMAGLHSHSGVYNKYSYLFSWGNVPGNDSERFLRFLTADLDIGWAKNAEIRKSGKTIHIFKGGDSAEIMIDEIKEKATLKISDGRTCKLTVKKEKGKLSIYKDSEYIDPKLGAYGAFRDKWGEEVFKKVQDGSIWIELHKKQGSTYIF